MKRYARLNENVIEFLDNKPVRIVPKNEAEEIARKSTPEYKARNMAFKDLLFAYEDAIRDACKGIKSGLVLCSIYRKELIRRGMNL